MSFEKNKFEDWNIVVTGGTRGIGKGIAMAFLNAGASVTVTYTHNDQEASNFKESNLHFGDRLQVAKFDVGNSESVKKFYTSFEEKNSKLDVLVNNAGIKRDQITAMMSDEDWSKVLNVNLDGTFYMSRLAIPLMMKNRFGRIINLSSIGGKIGLSGQANYAATKAAQIAMAKVMAKETGKKGITVNCVCPGFIETDMTGQMSEEQKRENLASIPVKRYGTVEDVAHAVLFLASKEAAYITGTSLDVSGGLGV